MQLVQQLLHNLLQILWRPISLLSSWLSSQAVISSFNCRPFTFLLQLAVHFTSLHSNANREITRCRRIPIPVISVVIVGCGCCGCGVFDFGHMLSLLTLRLCRQLVLAMPHTPARRKTLLGLTVATERRQHSESAFGPNGNWKVMKESLHIDSKYGVNLIDSW